jgi:hypothetical protein
MKPLITKQQEQDYRAYVLAELRCARKRAQLALNEIDRIGMALKGGVIDSDTALEWLAETGTLEFLHPETEEVAMSALISSNEAAAAAMGMS